MSEQQQQQQQQQPHKRKRHARSPNEVQRFCRVCDDLAAMFNFGQICCESCKAFFRRNADRRFEDCRNGGSCPITVATRRNCRACRFEKCLSVGMQLNLVMTSPSSTLSDGSQVDQGPTGQAALESSDNSGSGDGLGIEACFAEIDYSDLASAVEPEAAAAAAAASAVASSDPPTELTWEDTLAQIVDCCDLGTGGGNFPTEGAAAGGVELGTDHNHNRRCPNVIFGFGGSSSSSSSSATQAEANRRDEESDFVSQVAGWVTDCVDADLAVPFAVRHDLRRGLGERLDSWQEMIIQLEIFMQPVIQFCRLFFQSAMLSDAVPDWRQEYSVQLVKLRLHTLLVPMFSLKTVPGRAGQLQVSIAGSIYSVDPNRSISHLDRSFAPGLSALTANDRYFAYLHRVTETRPSLIGLFSLLKLLDLSECEPPEQQQQQQQQLLADICRRLFVRVSASLRRAFADEFPDRWQEKLRELAILFEWSKTFDHSLQSLFNGLSEHSPTPLFSEIYSG